MARPSSSSSRTWKDLFRDGEVLIEVLAAAINKADYILIRGKPFLVRLLGGGLLRPKDRIAGIGRGRPDRQRSARM